MRALTKIVVVVPSNSSVGTEHTFHVSIHKDIMKNENRFKSHCASIVTKNYGKKAVIKSITKGETDVV